MKMQVMHTATVTRGWGRMTACSIEALAMAAATGRTRGEAMKIQKQLLRFAGNWQK
jgi:hypothetical protein